MRNLRRMWQVIDNWWKNIARVGAVRFELYKPNTAAAVFFFYLFFIISILHVRHDMRCKGTRKIMKINQVCIRNNEELNGISWFSCLFFRYNDVIILSLDFLFCFLCSFQSSLIYLFWFLVYIFLEQINLFSQREMWERVTFFFSRLNSDRVA